MNAVKVEHFALQVSDPIAMSDWYVKNLGCSIARSGGEPSHARFLMDAGGSVMLYSGNGAQTQFDLGFGGTSRDFSYAFDYALPGSFAPSFMLSGSYTEKHDETVYLYDYTQTSSVISTKCRFPCVTYITKLIPVYGTKTFDDSHAFSYTGSLSMQAAPPLATRPFARCLAATGGRARAAALRAASASSSAPRRPMNLASWPAVGNMPLRKSRLPTSTDSTYAPNGCGGAGSWMPSSSSRCSAVVAIRDASLFDMGLSG